MVTALRLNNEKDGIAGGYEVVTASDLRRLGKKAARALNYVCAHAGCHIKVLPVFPEAIGKDGKVLECHFRALQGVFHIGHGAPAKPKEMAHDASTGGLSSSQHPSGWRDPNQARSSAASGLRDNTIKSSTVELSDADNPNKGSRGGGIGTTSATSVLRKLVERWESEQPLILDEVFTFPGRKNTRWRDMFIKIGSDQFR